MLSYVPHNETVLSGTVECIILFVEVHSESLVLVAVQIDRSSIQFPFDYGLNVILFGPHSIGKV